MRKLFVAFVLVVFATIGAGFVPAQQATRPSSSTTTVHPFEPSEELVYGAEFSRALLRNVDVAEFRFTARRQEPLTQKIESRDLDSSPYLLKLTGEIFSKGFFSKLFNLRFRESMESIVEPASFTVQKTKRIDEQGKRKRVSEALYANGKVSWVERDPNNPSSAPRIGAANFTGQVQDVLSAIYFLRTQPLAVGQTLQLTISDSGRVYKVPVRVLEKKRMRTAVGRVDALRVEPELFGPGGMMDRKGQLSIWYTADNRHIPVKAIIKTEYGTFDVKLRKIIRNQSSQEYLTKATN
jgi:uncharacterized protein DUF3108